MRQNMLFIKKVTFSRLDFIESFFLLRVCVLLLFLQILLMKLKSFYINHFALLFYFNVTILLYPREISANYLLKRYPPPKKKLINISRLLKLKAFDMQLYFISMRLYCFFFKVSFKGRDYKM